MSSLALGTIGLLLTTLGFEFGDHWPYHLGQVVGVAGAAITFYSLLAQRGESRTYERVFTIGQWKNIAPDGWEIHIPRSVHEKHVASTATAYVLRNGEYSQTICEIAISPSGGVMLRADEPFDGKVLMC